MEMQFAPGPRFLSSLRRFGSLYVVTISLQKDAT